MILGTNLSTTMIANTIGVGSNDVGTLCTSNKINPWSRYKPVPFKDKVVFEDTIITVNSHASWNDTPITTGDGAQNLPWYRGSYNYPLYSVPTITSYSDMFSGGTMNSSSKWIYNKPNLTLSQPARMGDFVGYNHTAICPLQAYTNYTPFTDSENNVTPNKTHIDKYIYAGFNNLDNALNDTLAKENGELSFNNIVGFMTAVVPAPLYLCIVIHNVTQNITRSYSKATNILTTEGQSFQLKIDDSSNIANGGIAHTVAIDDVLEIGVYLSQTPNSEGIGTPLNLGFSLNTDPITAPHVCRTVTIGTASIPTTTQYRILYTINSFNYSSTSYLDEVDTGFSGALPTWINTSDTFADVTGVAYQVEKGVSNIATYLTIQKLQIYNYSTQTWEDTTKDSNFVFNLQVLVRASAISDDILFGYLILHSAQYTGVSMQSSFNISGNKVGNCNYYVSQSDAENKLYGTPVAAIPLPLPRVGQGSYTDIDFTLSLFPTLVSDTGGITDKTLGAVAQSGTSTITLNN